MPTTQDTKTFKNPSGYWEHNGAFSVELVGGADKSIIPSSAQIRGNTVVVQSGRIKQTIGGIQLYSQESPFYWGYPWIKVIRDSEGNLLWVNYNHR